MLFTKMTTALPAFPPTDLTTPNRATTETEPGTLEDFWKNIAPMNLPSYDMLSMTQFYLAGYIYGTSLWENDFLVQLYDGAGTYIDAARYVTYSHDYFDFDMELTFRALKQERGRGKLEIIQYQGYWVPLDGLLNEARVTKHIWDLEASDTFSLVVTGPKERCWRSLNNTPTGFSINAEVPVGWKDLFEKKDVVTPDLGRVLLRPIVPYESGVGPAECDVIVCYRLLNLKTAQYRRLYGRFYEL